MSSFTDLSVAGGGSAGLIVVSRDVSRQRREEHLALHDALTDLPNRRMLVNRLYEALARKTRGGGLLAVLFLDLDQFKPINDTYGHAVGDEVLIETACRLTGAVRQTDLVARLGGDEFVAVLEEAGKEDNVRTVLERIQDALKSPMSVADGTRSLSVAASVGAVLVGELAGEPVNPERLIEAADAAMYEAKRVRSGSMIVNL
jgi:diguanylate cyclase (GGDEF)-like protein